MSTTCFPQNIHECFVGGGGHHHQRQQQQQQKNNNKNKTRDWSQVSFNPTVISAQSCTSAKILACLFICLFAYRYPCLYSLFTLTLTDTFSLRKKDINFIKGRYYLSLDVFIPVTAKPLGKLGALTSPCKLITDIKTKQRHSPLPHQLHLLSPSSCSPTTPTLLSVCALEHPQHRLQFWRRPLHQCPALSSQSCPRAPHPSSTRRPAAVTLATNRGAGRSRHH